MKILKRILFLLLGIIVLALIVALFVPNEFKAQSTITINKPQQEVYDFIKFIKNQDRYGKWQLMDTAMKKTYQGTDGTEGFIYTWESDVVGNGKQQIVKLKPADSIVTALYFMDAKEPAHAQFALKALTPESTQVTWGIEGRMNYPFNIMNLFMSMNKDFDEGLQNLKRVMEQP
jgi:hypothetical protein